MNVYALAEELGKFAWEVEELPPEEFAHWVAYYKIRREQQKKAQQQADAKSRSSKGRR